MTFTRHLNFSTNPSRPLGFTTQLVLIFSPQDRNDLYRDMFPVVYKTVNLPSHGTSMASVTYVDSYGFAVAQEESGGVVISGTAALVQMGDTDTLTGNMDVGFQWSEARGTAGDRMIARNSTGHPVDIAFGTAASHPFVQVKPTLLLRKLAAANQAVVERTPILRVYASSDYQEGEYIRGEIQSPILLEIDVTRLGDRTNWLVFSDPATGQVMLQQE